MKPRHGRGHGPGRAKRPAQAILQTSGYATPPAVLEAAARQLGEPCRLAPVSRQAATPRVLGTAGLERCARAAEPGVMAAKPGPPRPRPIRPSRLRQVDRGRVDHAREPVRTLAQPPSHPWTVGPRRRLSRGVARARARAVDGEHEPVGRGSAVVERRAAETGRPAAEQAEPSRTSRRDWGTLRDTTSRAFAFRWCGRYGRRPALMPRPRGGPSGPAGGRCRSSADRCRVRCQTPQKRQGPMSTCRWSWWLLS